MTKNIPDFKTMSRIEVLTWVETLVGSGELSLGGAIRVLRRNIAKQNQAEFAQLCGLSRRTLVAIESDEANPTVQTVNQLLKLFGLQLGLARLHRNSEHKQ